MKRQSLRSQLTHPVVEAQSYGESKHSDKHNPEVDTMEKIYSKESSAAFKDTINNFVNFMIKAHPEIKNVDELTAEHFNEWIEARQGHWTNKTYDNMIFRIKKLEILVNKSYKDKKNSKGEKIHVDFHTNLHERDISRMDKKEIRKIAMSQSDYDKLHEDLSKSRSKNALRAIELAEKIGARINEAAELRFKNIDIINNVVHLTEGTKNGKKRDVPIQEKDHEYFYDLTYGRNGEDHVCGNIETDSLSKSIRRGMKRVGISKKYDRTSQHAIRKMYATRRFNEELKRFNGDERKAWSVVQQELGHGKGFRPNLFNTYIKK